ncbi:ADP-ribose pyrophosphatase [Angomonas deanei]|uniref:NUDIX domain containing protein, putative n=1 Tax=Angomonas deanei TaxID=59799 RepID=A0A7G2C049_9TRYP|nr:ADP-ribose pyrophosphatase [Angomonas deanei]CAD2212895.1 NUDIX domain containing protein, putative [Angomonas deanei]|eukprot:EPY42045.1 ADP-ribose pyrophosphatase [Angomonas deanei]
MEKVTEKQVCHAGRFLVTSRLNYESRGEAREWEMVERVGGGSLGRFAESLDAVDICATLVGGGGDFLVLVLQFRPPIGCLSLEFPSGLIDAGETPISAAIRELKEETGYVVTTADVLSVSQPLSYEPGLCNSCCSFVQVKINSDTPENISPKQSLDENENIEVVLFPLGGKDLLVAVNNFVSERTEKVIVDAKLYTYLLGLNLAVK